MFLKLLTHLVGGNEFVSSITLDQLSRRFSTSALYRKKINQAGELDVKKIVSSAVIKSVIGGDIIDAEFKGKDHFSFQCHTKCVFATNQLPVLDAKVREDAFFDRFQFIEFDTPVPRDRQITNFEKTLLNREGEGILFKCVEILHQLLQNRLQFAVSAQAKKLKERFQNEKNPVEMFLEERCVFDTSCSVTNQDLFGDYVQYCRENCFDAQFTNHMFVKEVLRVTGLPKKKLHKHRASSALWGIEGIDLKLEHMEHLKPELPECENIEDSIIYHK